MIKHHPDVSTLMSCAAGSQPEAQAAVIASHLSECPDCARRVQKLEQIGAVLFDNIEAAPMSRSVSTAAIRAQDAIDGSEMNGARSEAKSDVPAALVGLIGPSLDAIAWKRLSTGIWHYPLPLSEGAKGDLRLIKVAPGHVLPEHGHGGSELTLVLRGSYDDSTGHYAAGDVADLDEDIEHTPVACAKDGCICLIASEKPARFKSLLARMMQPLAGL